MGKKLINRFDFIGLYIIIEIYELTDYIIYREDVYREEIWLIIGSQRIPL